LYWPDFSMRGMRSLLRFGGQVAASQLFWMFFSQVDILLCAKLLGKEVLGFYSVAMHLASLPNQRISGLVNQVAFPAFSSMQHDIERVGTNMLAGIRILSFFAFPVLWGVSSVAPEIVEVVLGSRWASAAIPLQVLGLVMPLRMMGNFVQVAMQGIGRSNIVLRNAITAAAIAPIIFFAGIYWGGLLGLSLAWLVVSPFVFLQGALRGLPVLGLRFKMLLLAMMPAASASLVMYGAVVALGYLPVLAHEGALRLCALVSMGALAYVLASIVLNRKGAQEVIAMLRGIATAKSPDSAKG
jgi:teichuronic acid exporter